VDGTRKAANNPRIRPKFSESKGDYKMSETLWVAVRRARRQRRDRKTDNRSYYLGHGYAINIHLVYKKRTWQENKERYTEVTWIEIKITYTSMKNQVERIRGVRSSKKERIDLVTLLMSDQNSGDKFMKFIDDNHLQNHLGTIQKKIDEVKEKHPEGMRMVTL
jgi:hypothetical protein